MIRLVVTDVDGTIVPKDELLRDEVLTMVENLHNADVVYTIATGRVDSQVQEYVKKLGLKTSYITCNGGTIIKNGEVVLRYTVPLAPLRKVVDAAENLDMSVLYSIEGVEKACRLTEYVRQQQINVEHYLDICPFNEKSWDTLNIDKLIIMAKVRDGSLDAIEELCKKLPQEYGYKRYANKAIEILHCNATKEKGIEKLADMLNIDMSEVMAVGDDMNDIGMIRAAGIGVAVQNAQPPVKEVADYVTQSDCYFGVIEAVERFCFGKETVD